ncbi:paladin isoform X3 [Prionailurus viverrinus]|nr:paladin isoform X3 [Prionailurus viverrinus]
MDVLGTVQSCGAPNFRQVRGGLTVFGMGQPTLSGFRRVLQKLQEDGHRECIIFCVREEPVLFLRAGEDFVPYTPRDKQNLRENLQGLGPGIQAESLELAIRKEIHDFAQLSENTYHVYHNIEDLLGEPHAVAIRGEDDVHVTEEVFKRPLFLQPTYRYHRLPLPEQGAPLEAQFDAFVSVLRETPSLLPLRDAHGPPPALLFSCQTGVGRTNLGMTLGTLILFHHSRAASRPEAVPLQTKPLPMEQLQVIQSFLHMVPQGRKMVDEVDRAITACAEMHNLKEAILENQRKLESVRPAGPAQGSSSQHGVRQRALQSLERYFYLVLFNYYLHEQYPLAFALSFSRWLCAHPELYRLPVTLSSAGPVVPGDLLTKGSLGADDLISPDALSTVREMDVANFRRVPRMPIYGTAQPSAKALGSILAYLTDAKRKLKHVVWVNLREEAVLECDGHTHSLRWPGPPMAPDQLEHLEIQLKAHLSTPLPGTGGPPTHRFQTCLTTREVFAQHRGAYPGLTYHRIPMPDFCAPCEEDFDRLLEALRAALAKDAGTGFVFSCLSGQGRTTTAMVVAVLAFWHIQGFPEVGEEELVSVPDAKFTKGEFEVVMKVVQLLPAGHQVKKEVDAALDTVSETMTPMHYHLREIIICTYRQEVFIYYRYQSLIRPKRPNRSRRPGGCSFGAYSTWSATFTWCSSTPTSTWRRPTPGRGPSAPGCGRWHQRPESMRSSISWASPSWRACRTSPSPGCAAGGRSGATALSPPLLETSCRRCSPAPVCPLPQACSRCSSLGAVLRNPFPSFPQRLEWGWDPFLRRGFDRTISAQVYL